MWIARDKDGLLCIYRHKPFKGNEVWIENPEEKDGMYIIPENYFPEVKWEDEKPRKLILKSDKEE